MENLALTSLIALFAAILIGFFRKTNVGIIAIAVTIVIGKLFGIGDKDLISGFSASLFMTMVGVSYLFGLLSDNKTLETMSAKIVSLSGNNRIIIPIIMFVLGALICGIGPGAIPSLAIMPIIAVPIAVSSGYNPILLSIIAQCGVMGGRMSPLTPEAAVVINLMSEQGLNTDMLPIYLCHIVTGILISIAAFIFYKGWHEEETTGLNKFENVKFDKNQIISLIGLILMIILVLVFKFNVGLASFGIGAILAAIGVANEGVAIKKIPWGVILLVLGVGILMNIVSISGGVDLLANNMSKIMGKRSASAVMVAGASLMSFFSSGLGVVFPTLIPTVHTISSALGGIIDPKELVAAVTMGGTFAGLSPISTTGALIMSAVASDDAVSNKFPQNKLFVELIGWSLFSIVLEVILSLLGVYSILV